MNLFENTIFINLEKRKDRLKHVLNEFKKLNIKGERFNAIQSRYGAIGCSLSHIECLEIANKVAGFSTTKLGAGDSMPTLNDINLKV